MKGLTGTGNSGKEKDPTMKVEQSFKVSPMKREKVRQSQPTSRLQYQTQTNSDTVVAVENSSANPNLQDLDDQIKSMMTKTDVKTGKSQEYLASCNICGKEAVFKNIQRHIEANHIIGVSHSCNICGKTSKSRNALGVHKHTYHKTLLQD